MLHRNCSFNCELDVRILNHPNWTSITRVMVHFPGLSQVASFDPIHHPDFGTDFRLGKRGNLD